MHTTLDVLLLWYCSTEQHVTYSCMCPFIPHSLHTAVENNSSPWHRRQRIHSATMKTATVGKDRPADNSAVVHLHTVRGEGGTKRVKMNTGITIKGNALGVAAIQRPEQTSRCFNWIWISYGGDNPELMVLKMVRCAWASTCCDSGLPSSSGITNRLGHFGNWICFRLQMNRTNLTMWVRQNQLKRHSGATEAAEKVPLQLFIWCQKQNWFTTRRRKPLLLIAEKGFENATKAWQRNFLAKFTTTNVGRFYVLQKYINFWFEKPLRTRQFRQPMSRWEDK
jgi:hypothetical protein